MAGPVAAHDGRITSVLWAGDAVVTAGVDGAVRIWNLDGAMERQLGDVHTGGANALALSGSQLATADHQGTVRIYDVASGDRIAGPLAADDNAIRDLDFSPSGELLATASADEVVTVWDVGSLEAQAMLTPHPSEAKGVVFLDDATIASLDGEGRVRLWDVGLQRQLGGTLAGHDATGRDIAAGAGGAVFVTSAENGTVHVWNLLDLDVACARSEGVFDIEQQRRYLDESSVEGCTGMAQ